MKVTLRLCFLLTHWLLFGEGWEVRFKLDVQGLGGGRIWDVGGQGGGWSRKLDNFMDFVCVSSLNIQSCKLYNNKYMMASTQITNTGILAFIADIVFKSLSRKLL